MATTFESLPDSPVLFNNPQRSDIIIRQFCNGQVKQYFAHKCVLDSSGSAWFQQLIRGNYINPRTNIIELHQDDPVHFELVLKWLYTREWDRDIEAKRGFWGESCPRSQAFVAVGVYALANKYNIPSLREYTFEKLLSNPVIYDSRLRGWDDLLDMVLVHCPRCLWPGCMMCHLIWEAFWESGRAEDVHALDLIERGFWRVRNYLVLVMQAEARETRLGA
ncbi:hypothetical protein DE146DRAFT_302566 [Phaeosphaeria sp. MPI-PUGE-AT-0046c]|nr:hypothetical protein DE146DRAFT_302566 [Phaeosphaeria sp. MPI-PUGE-AT-0046c]